MEFELPTDDGPVADQAGNSHHDDDQTVANAASDRELNRHHFIASEGEALNALDAQADLLVAEGEPQFAPEPKEKTVRRLREQNEMLKTELRALARKLDEFVNVQRNKAATAQASRRSAAGGLPPLPMSAKGYSEAVSTYDAKERELRETERKLGFYRKEIAKMRSQLDGSYNIQQIIALEDDQANKLRILKELEGRSRDIASIAKFQKRAIRNLKASNVYEKKVDDLTLELKQAKDHFRKLQVIERDDSLHMRALHQHKIGHEEKLRKIQQQVKERRKLKALFEAQKAKNPAADAEMRPEVDYSNAWASADFRSGGDGLGPRINLAPAMFAKAQYDHADLELIQAEINALEAEKANAERQQKDELQAQEKVIKQLAAKLKALEDQAADRAARQRIDVAAVLDIPPPMKPVLDRNLSVVNEARESDPLLVSRQEVDKPFSLPVDEPVNGSGVLAQAQTKESIGKDLADIRQAANQVLADLGVDRAELSADASLQQIDAAMTPQKALEVSRRTDDVANSILKGKHESQEFETRKHDAQPQPKKVKISLDPASRQSGRSTPAAKQVVASPIDTRLENKFK